jgi:hypothetical protein
MGAHRLFLVGVSHTGYIGARGGVLHMGALSDRAVGCYQPLLLATPPLGITGWKPVPRRPLARVIPIVDQVIRTLHLG